jgi:hypothetical protein
MELPGSAYLYALATISITYAGFAALIVVFRQTTTGKLTSYDLFFVRSVLLRSFIVIVCAMLPPVLALFDLPHPTIWRISSLIAGLLQAVFVLTWPLRRRSISDVPITKWILIQNGLILLTAIYLLSTAFDIFFKPASGPFAIGLSIFLYLSFTSYLISLEVLLRGYSKEKRRK